MKINVIVIILLILVACDKQSELRVEEAPADQTVEVMEVQQVAPPVKSAVLIERKLIKNGSIEFETKDWKKTKGQIGEVCQSLDAYSSDESLRNFNNRISYHQLIRVPSGRFEELVDRLEKLSEGLENKSITVNDVTEEYMDIEVRVKNKKEMENRYRELLKQAKTVEDMLTIENNISEVRTEIETMEGKLKYMQNRVALSTLEVTYYETYYEKIGADFGFGSKLVNSLSNGWDSLLALIIGVANIWPFIILFSLAGWLLRRRLRLKPVVNGE